MPIETVKIVKIRNKKKEITNDLVTKEIPFTINLDSSELVTLLCTPSDLKDLATGFLFSTAIIKNNKDIRNIIIDDKNWIAAMKLEHKLLNHTLAFKRLYTSGCGRGILFYSAVDIMHRTKINSSFKIKSEKIIRLMLDFQKRAKTFVKTGGTHSAALANEDKILIFREDIGRHNAIDKVIGAALINDVPFKNKIMLSSGRISSEVIYKVQKCKIPMVVSRSAPTDQAVKLAQDSGIILIGFVRGIRMNIYSNEKRIVC